MMLEDETSLWDVDHELARDRILARRRRIGKRLDMSAKLSAGLDQLLQLEAAAAAEEAAEEAARAAARSAASTPQSPAAAAAGGTPATGAATGPGSAAAPAGKGKAVAEAKEERKELEPMRDYVKTQCRSSRALLTEALESGGELVSNVRLAVDNMGAQHRDRLKVRNTALDLLLKKEKEDSKKEVENIDKKWPRADVRGVVPTELFAQIHEQRSRCNALLEKKNDLIATLEEEVRDSNDQFKLLIGQYRENVSVLCARMEQQLQTLEAMVGGERRRLEEAHATERRERAARAEGEWERQLAELNAASEGQMERRLQMLSDHESELDRMITEDNEAFIDIKHSLEDDIRVLTDQLHFMTSLHQLNEERLDYEIHVLKKHEEEIVLVKSEQKRKITTLQDSINRLRTRVAEAHRGVAREEAALQAVVKDVRGQLDKLEAAKKKQKKHAERKKSDILEMVRDEAVDELREMAKVDQQIRRVFVSPDARRVPIYLKPLKVEDEAEKGGRRAATASGEVRRAQPGPSVEGAPRASSASDPAGRRRGKSLAELDFKDGGEEDGKEEEHPPHPPSMDLKPFLRDLVYRANFLVEENLNLLVEADDILEDERALFRLDSILATIGVEQEAEVAAVLDRHRGDADRARREILKVIRAHMERQEVRFQTAGGAGVAVASTSSSSSSSGAESSSGSPSTAPSSASSSRRKASAGGDASGAAAMAEAALASEEREQEEEWERMVKSVRRLYKEEEEEEDGGGRWSRVGLLDRARRLQERSAEARRAREENATLRRQVRELEEVAVKIRGGGGSHFE